jgi:hypothetical protein
MESGHWFHTNAEIDVCTGWDRQTITLPRGIEVPLAVNVDGSPQYFRGRLFQYHVNKGGMYNPVDWAWDDRGFVATTMDIRQPSQLVAVAESDNDVGKKIRVVGTDSNNRTLRSQLDDGTGVDGLLVTIHSQSDFAYGLIAPEPNTIDTRSAAITPLNAFLSTTAHQLASGQGMAINFGTGTLPYLVNGETYYVGVVDANTIHLYKTELDAKSGNNPISLQSIVGTSSLTLTDSRKSQLVTVVETTTSPTISIDSPNQVTFNVTGSSTLPAPLISGATYYANQVQTQTGATGIDLQVFTNIDDANANTNPVSMTDGSGSFNVQIRKPIAPETIFTFTANHYFSSGDVVQAVTSGGTLPQPLLANQNYYVHAIDGFTISIHTNYADAIAGTNPITITGAGSGTNSFVKLIQATANIGQTNNINVQGFNLQQATGSGGVGKARVSGSITQVVVDASGTKYTSTPALTIDDTGGTGYTSAPKVVITNPIGFVSPLGNNFSPATFTTTLTSNYVSAVTATDAFSGGQGYDANNPPTVTIVNQTSDTTGYGAQVAVSVSPIVNDGFGNLSGGKLTLTLIGWGSGFTATVQTGSDGGTQPSLQINSIVVTNSGSGYLYAPRLTLAGSQGGGTNATCHAIIQYSPLDHIDVVSGGVGYKNPPAVTITGAGGSGAVATANINTGITAITLASQNGQGYTTGAKVTITDSTGTGATATCTVSGGAIATVTVTNSGVGYTNPTITFSNIDGSTPTVQAQATATYGTITSFTIVAAGTNYSSNPTVTINPSTGVFVQFSSTGAVPTGLVQGTSYRAEAPFSQNGFTVKNSDFSAVNITDLGTGTLYLVISRPFAIAFNSKWIGIFNGLANGAKIYFGTDYLLPVGTPTISAGTAYYFGRISDTEGYIYSNAILTNKVTVTSLGTGQSYYAVQLVANAKSYNNLITPSSIEYLSAGETVSFSSTGTLPSPLTAYSTYTIQLSGKNIQVYSGGSQVSFTSLGTGILSLNVARTFSTVASTSITCDEAFYPTGTQVVVRSKTDDTLPTGLSAGTAYYVRRNIDTLGSDKFELYDTLANATNTALTTGRITYTSTGNDVTSTFFVDGIEGPIYVKAVQHIDKPQTDGYVSLYAFDYGRSNDMALIGQYHPTETNPMYRRIRIGKPCAWARILYRVQSPKITSVYDYIPIENQRAIIAAVHAVDLEDKDFIEQSQKYWAMSLSYLKNQQTSMEGHAMMPAQINNITYGDGTDPVMF